MFEHPSIATIGSGTFLISYILSKDTNSDLNGLIQKLSNNPNKAVALGLLTAGFCTASYYLCKESAIYFHSSSKHLRKDMYKLSLTKIFYSKEKVLEKYSLLVKKHPYTTILSEYATLLAEQGNNFLAFELLNKIYEQKKPESTPYTHQSDSLNVLSALIHYNYSAIKKSPKSFPRYLALALIMKSLGKKDKMIEIMDWFSIETDKHEDLRLNANLSKAIFLKRNKEIPEFRKQFIKILELCSDNLKRIKNFQTYTIEENDFSRKTFVIRKSKDEKPLRDERSYNELIKNNFKNINENKKLKVLETPEVFNFKKEFYSTTFYETGETLSNYLKKSFNLNVFEDVARFMGLIHGSNNVSESKELSSHINKLFSRIEKTNYHELNNLKKIIFDNIPLLFEGFDDFLRVVDIDAHGENWIIGDKYTKIDNQYRKPTLPFFECSKLIEQSVDFLNDEYSDNIRDRVLSAYHDELSNFHKTKDFDEILFHKLKSDFIKATSYFFFAYKDNSKNNTNRRFLRNSTHSLDRLESYLEYKQELECMNNLKTASIEMQSLI
jgi:hypothetical protein